MHREISSIIGHLPSRERQFATEEDKEKYHCGKFMTYPIVDEDLEVREDDSINLW